MTPMNALSHRAKTRPNGTAFIYDDIAWTYRDLLTGAEQLSRGFVARGVRQGDRVVLHMANSLEMAVALYACFRIGAIACPTNLRFKTAELREGFQRLQSALYLGDEQFIPTSRPSSRRSLQGTSASSSARAVLTKAPTPGRRYSPAASAPCLCHRSPTRTRQQSC